MGGYNSGRRDGRTCTDEVRALDVRRLARDGLLTPGPGFGWAWTRRGEKVASITIWPVEADRVRLQYSRQLHDGQKQEMDYPVRLVHTPCHLGGVRVWWSCPAAGCGRRVAVLYLGGSIFACRHCHRLAYRSQRESAIDRIAGPADKLRERLGWKAGIFNPNGGRPKGMHWKTYWRLRSEYEHHASRALGALLDKLKRI